MITYKQQFDKLTRAYINNEVKPYSSCSCFIGNLLNNINWAHAGRQYNWMAGLCVPMGFYNTWYIEEILNQQADSFYTPFEIDYLEKLFLKTFHDLGGKRNNIDEDALFTAFEKTLDLLKQIHIAHGETIDEVPVFSKRVLQTI